MSRNTKQLSFEEAVKNVDRWITIRNENEAEAIIEIDGEIGDDWWGEGENTVKAVKAKLKQISNLKASKIVVNINSYGGDVSHGLGIHDVLAQHKAEIETNVQGLTASAATIIAQAGDVRKMSDNALYLIHQPWSLFISNVTELEQDLQDMRTINDRLVKIYTKRSGQSEESIRELMDANNGNGKWIDADEAEEMGLVDEIYEPMKAAASVRKLNDKIKVEQRLPDLPESKDPTIKNSIDMSDDKKTLREMFNDFKTEIMDGVKSLLGKEELPEEISSKLNEFDNRIKEVEDENPAGELQEQVNSLTAELETANNTISEKDAEIANLTTAKNELEGQLTKKNAKSTKTKAPEGLENPNAEDNSELASLNADAAKIRAEMMIPHSDDHVDEDED